MPNASDRAHPGMGKTSFVTADSRHALFGVAPEEFVAARDALVRELKDAGAKADAAEIKRLRRPSVAVWALNQVSRTNPDAVHRLLVASATARDAQVNG